MMEFMNRNLKYYLHHHYHYYLSILLNFKEDIELIKIG